MQKINMLSIAEMRDKLKDDLNYCLGAKEVIKYSKRMLLRKRAGESDEARWRGINDELGELSNTLSAVEERIAKISLILQGTQNDV